MSEAGQVDIGIPDMANLSSMGADVRESPFGRGRRRRQAQGDGPDQGPFTPEETQRVMRALALFAKAHGLTNAEAADVAEQLLSAAAWR